MAIGGWEFYGDGTLVPRSGYDPTRIVTRNPGADAATRILTDRVGGPGGETVILPQSAQQAAGSASFDPVVGWLVVKAGPGKGMSRTVHYGQSSIGRGSDQRIVLDFGDQRIARDTHAIIVYDDKGRKFYLRDTGKANIVRLRGAPVLQPVEIKDRDEIEIGDTTLLFVALCNDGFDWLAADAEPKA